MSYTKARAVVGEGARIGIITCLDCGAALVLDPNDDFDVVALHDNWHTTNHPSVNLT